LTDFRPIQVIEAIDKNLKIFSENLQFQKKRFTGVLGSIKRNFNLVHLFDIYQESDEFDEEQTFHSEYLAHSYQESWSEDYKLSKGKYSFYLFLKISNEFRTDHIMPRFPPIKGIHFQVNEKIKFQKIQLGSDY
jgi:hypothetical protein